MSPQEWIDFEEKVKKIYEDKTVGELMDEANILTFCLNNPQKYPNYTPLQWDKLNLQLRVILELFEKRIDSIIARSERNGS